MSEKYNPWDVLAWIAFGIVVVYFLLKAVGILNSPLSINVVAIISGSYFIGRQFMKLDYVCKDVERLKTDVNKLNEKASTIDNKLDKHILEGHK